MSNAAQLAVGSYLSRRNRIINGAMQVNQRANGGLTQVASTYLYCSADRWALVSGGGATVGAIQESISYADGNGIFKVWLQQRVTTAVTDFSGTKYWSGFFQAIEGWRAYDLVGNPNGICVSFWFRAKIAGTYGVTLNDGAFAFSCTQSFAYTTPDTPVFITLSFPTMNANVSVGRSVAASATLVLRIGCINLGTSQSTQNGVWAAYANGYAAPNIVNWGATVGNYIAVTDVQLEEGPIPSAFDRKSIDEETLACQRYWWSSYPEGTAPGTSGQDSNAMWFYTGPTSQNNSYIGPTITLPVTMRAIPTSTPYNPHTGVTGSAYAQNAAASLACNIASASNKGITMGLTNQPISSGDFIKYHVACSAEFF